MFLATVILAALVDNARAQPDSPRLVSVDLVSAIGDNTTFDDKAKRARADQGVTLAVVLGFRSGRSVEYFSDAETVKIGRKRRSVRPLSEAPASDLYWFKVEPAISTMSNTESGSFRFERIEYAETGVLAWLGKSTVQADVRPTLTPDRGDGVGTMRYRVVAVSGLEAVATAGAEAVRTRASGGLLDDVHRVSLRKDDTYLGFLTELYGQPYIWASGGANPNTHQSERLEGADCADFIVYARRRQGHELPYTWTGDLPKFTNLLHAGTADEDGVYRDENGEKIPYPNDGDIVLFPRHVGVLGGDYGEGGTLDHEDIIIHAYFDTPKAQPLGDTAYASAPTEVRRWR